MRSLTRALGLWIVMASMSLVAHAQSDREIVVTLDPAIAKSFTGRIYLLFSKRREPRFGPSWFSADPFAAVDVKHWRAGDPLAISEKRVVSYPVALNKIPVGEYQVQAVIRLNLDSPKIGTGAGNAYSEVVRVDVTDDGHKKIELLIDQVVRKTTFPVTERMKQFALRSEMLSRFHGRDILMKATIILPPGYDESGKRRYPVEYWIGGFGSDHRVRPRSLQRWDSAPRSDEIVRVVLNPLCFGGHHVFADSANNGPRGKALVEEFIPALEAQFRFVRAAHGRFLSGHSSGGWSSLWLQVTYPETFGGTWSIAPDPVDFRSFQNPNIYAESANLLFDRDGKKIALAQRRGQAFYDSKKFSDMETVYGEGGQLRSFEWVFSPRGADGLPQKLYDRKTGAINATVANAWKKYDIGLLLKANWKTLAPRLKGKIHVICGDQDTFYLHHAAVRLQKTMADLGSDAVIELVEGANHSTVATSELKTRVRLEMLQAFACGGVK